MLRKRSFSRWSVEALTAVPGLPLHFSAIQPQTHLMRPKARTALVKGAISRYFNCPITNFSVNTNICPGVNEKFYRRIARLELFHIKHNILNLSNNGYSCVSEETLERDRRPPKCVSAFIVLDVSILQRGFLFQFTITSQKTSNTVNRSTRQNSAQKHG